MECSDLNGILILHSILLGIRDDWGRGEGKIVRARGSKLQKENSVFWKVQCEVTVFLIAYRKHSQVQDRLSLRKERRIWDGVSSLAKNILTIISCWEWGGHISLGM